MPRPSHPDYASYSQDSPGPVKDEEEVVRFVLHPYHVIKKTNKIKPTAIFRDKDLSSIGGSVDRSLYSDSDLRGNYVGLLTVSGVSCLGAIKLSVGRLRSILDEQNERVFFVYATGKDYWPSHADIYGAANYELLPREEQLRLRSMLYELAGGKIMQLEEI